MNILFRHSDYLDYLEDRRNEEKCRYLDFKALQ